MIGLLWYVNSTSGLQHASEMPEFQCPKRRASARQDAGFALAILIFFLTAASIMLAAAVPVYQMQAKRAQEDELIFRGEEYMRAIQKYQRRFNVYPPSVDAMLDTNGVRFLRRAYKDPITNKEFRLISINPDGSVSGSAVLAQGLNGTSQTGTPGTPLTSINQGQRAQNPQLNQIQSQNQTQLQSGQLPQQRSQQLNQAPFASGPAQTNPTSPFGFGQQPQTQPFQSQTQPFQSQTRPLQSQTQQQLQSQIQQRSPVSQPGQLLGQTGITSGNRAGQIQPGGQSNSGLTAGIIGVASDSELESIKVYNGRQKYKEWEFIAILQPGQQQPGQQQPGLQQPGQQQNVPQQFGQPQPGSQLPGQQQQRLQSTPFGNTLPNPLGPTQTNPTSPFGFGQQPQTQPGRRE
jgi:hypothetical protein